MADSNVELVKNFLRAANLEQVGKIEEAIELYERIVSEGFDSSGPYDRLIGIYGRQTRHQEVVRVAETALKQVHTHGEKHSWYERMRTEAIKAQSKVPRASRKNRPQ